jgi:Fe-S-cluster-containing hydrogenase component 2
VDIYQSLLDASKRQKKVKREELLKPLGVKEFFEEGSIKVDLKTCKGAECKFCIKVCPTSALYWKAGEIGVVEELCIYCSSCVLNCMVDGCIEVKRRRENGENERLNNPKDVFRLCKRLNIEKRMDAVKMSCQTKKPT